MRVAVRDIGALDTLVLERTRRQGAARGAAVGALVAGVPSGLLIAGVAIAGSRDCTDFCGLGTLIVGVLGVGLTAVMTGVGALIGVANPGHVWRAVPTARIAAGVAPRPPAAVAGAHPPRPRVQVGVALRF